MSQCEKTVAAQSVMLDWIDDVELPPRVTPYPFEFMLNRMLQRGLRSHKDVEDVCYSLFKADDVTTARLEATVDFLLAQGFLSGKASFRGFPQSTWLGKVAALLPHCENMTVELGERLLLQWMNVLAGAKDQMQMSVLLGNMSGEYGWDALVTVAREGFCSTPTLGTFWRFGQLFTNYTARQPLYSVMQSPAMPPQVAAKLALRCQEMKTPTGLWVDTRGWEGFIARASATYPEVAGLPDMILVETVASQPEPAEWSEDVVTVPVFSSPLQGGIV